MALKYAVTPPMPARDELARLIASRLPVVYLDSSEEARAEQLVIEACQREGRICWTWSISCGLLQVGESAKSDVPTREPVAALRSVAEHDRDDVFIFCDAGKQIANDPMAERLLRDIARQGICTVVLLGVDHDVPATLRTSAAVYELPRPDFDVIARHLNAVLQRDTLQRGVRNLLDDQHRDILIGSLRGLTIEQIDLVLAHVLHDDDQLTVEDLQRVVEEKRRVLSDGGLLTVEHPDRGLEWVAGFDNLKAWVAQRSKAFTPEAAAFGIEAPRGILLTGVPGCGKSFLAKTLAFTWNMPLLRLDAGSLYDSFVGRSERNLRDCLRTAGSLAPSILWIDEIEKGFGSKGASEADGGLAYRMLGTLATWMQERPDPVFLLATSNDIDKLPPELVRQGRFDEIFFVDLPDTAARQHLFALQFAGRGRDYTTFDCAALAEASEGFSGSEIEQAVTNALYAAFSASAELATEHVAQALVATRPLSVVSPDTIESIRAWGAERARPV